MRLLRASAENSVGQAKNFCPGEKNASHQLRSSRKRKTETESSTGAASDKLTTNGPRPYCDSSSESENDFVV